MSQLQIFDEDPNPVPLSAGEIVRLESRRRDYRRRQRKCRALKKWRKRTQNAPQFRDQGPFPEAEYCLVGSVFIARQFATRAFLCARTEDITDDFLRLIFAGARTVYDRGAPVTRQTVVAQLKREGVLLLEGGAMIDALVGITPARFTAYRVELWANEIKAAA